MLLGIMLDQYRCSTYVESCGIVLNAQCCPRLAVRRSPRQWLIDSSRQNNEISDLAILYFNEIYFGYIVLQF